MKASSHQPQNHVRYPMNGGAPANSSSKECSFWFALAVIFGAFNLTGFMQVARCQSAALAAQAQIAQQRANSVDCGDFYVTPRGEQKLYRLAGAVALRFEDGSETASVLSTLTASGGLFSEYTSELRGYGQIAVLKAPPVEGGYKLMSVPAPADVLDAARQVPGIRLASPVFVDPDSGFWMIPTGDIIVQLKEQVRPEMIFGDRQMHRPPATKRQFMLPLKGVTSHDIFAEVNQLSAAAGVEWAEPDFISQGLLCAPSQPADVYYSQQWHLNNTGQGGGTLDADVDAPEAWDLTTGSSNIVIAVLDVGVETNHPDLRQNLFTNSGDSDADGIDDDNNGYIDDAHGWDFYPGPSTPDGNNDANPKTAYDNHGTSVAGAAAARGDNGIGVAGVAYTSGLLPIRVGEAKDASGSFDPASWSKQAAAIRYAAGIHDDGSYSWRGADILNLSITMPPAAASTAIHSALALAATKGRDGKGCIIFCSTGNGADGWIGPFTIPINFGSAGRYALRLGWEYRKDASSAEGDDTVWLDEVTFPDGTVESFEQGKPASWTTRGHAPWTWVRNDAEGNHAMTGWRGQNAGAMRAGAVDHNGYSYLEVERIVEIDIAGVKNLTYYLWPSCAPGDGLRFFFNDNLVRFGPSGEIDTISGVPDVAIGVGYPASHPNTVAVGASTNFDYRADYSRYGTGIDFVAPSKGGSLGIYTTDRTGDAGYAPGSYTASFGGTSASTPLAAGVAALILSKNPDLMAHEVRDIMRNTCDKPDSVPYVNGWNQYYGYGRINARAALGVEDREKEAVKLIASDGKPGDQFGRSVSVSGDFAIVGAKDAAYLFKREGANWVEQDKLIPPSQRTYYHDLGRGVSVSGKYAVVAAMDTAHVYERSGTDWRHTAMLMAYPYESGDGFASSLSISGDSIIIGASHRTVMGYRDRGSAFIFRRYRGTWTQHQELTSWDFESDWDFGESVSISGDYAIVGIPQTSVSWSSDRDRVYIYERRNGQDWERAEKLISPESGTRFGKSVSISADYAVVRGGSSAYIFERRYGGWQQQGKLTVSDFGDSISIGTDYLIIGASNSAYVFKRTGSKWTQKARLTSPSGEIGVAFGDSVSLSGDYAVVGARYDDSKGGDSGAAYVFRLSKISD